MAKAKQATNIERAFERVLKELNLEYETQYKIPGTYKRFDFLIKGKPILVEVDGDYWHYNTDNSSVEKKDPTRVQLKNMRNDIYKNKLAFKFGYMLLRFWEKDILKDKNKIRDLLVEALSKIDSYSTLRKSITLPF